MNIKTKENSAQKSGGFVKIVNLDGYKIYSWHSESASCGVVLCVKSNLDYIIRDD